MNIAEIRQQYPQYSDLSDAQLAGALHQKYYSDMSLEEFSTKAGLKTETKKPATAQERFVASPMGRFAAGVATPVAGLAQMAVEPFMGGDSNPVTSRLRQLQEMQKAGLWGRSGRCNTRSYCRGR
jgi:hypothetical protein